MGNNLHTYTLDEIKDSVFKLLDEYSKNGEKSCEEDGYALDMAKRLPLYINSAIRKVYHDFPERKTVNIELIAPKIVKEIHNAELEKNKTIDFYLPEERRCVLYLNVCGNISFHINKTDHNTDSGMKAKLDNDSTTYNELFKYVGTISPIDKCSLFARSLCHVKDFVLFDYDSLFNMVKEEQYPPYGMCCAALPNDFHSVVRITAASGKAVSPSRFLSDSENNTLTADIGMKGEYSVEYAVKAPQFNSSASGDDSVELSPERFELVIRQTAAQICPPESTEAYIKLSHAYNSLLDVARSVCIPQSAQRNTFFAPARNVAPCRSLKYEDG